MPIRPRINRFIARLLAGVLLLAQMTVAAYACPSMLAGPADDVASSAVAGIHGQSMESDGGDLDADLPNLCLGHCQSGQQNTDSAHPPAVTVALLTTLYPLPPSQNGAGGSPPARVNGPPSAADPPHAILHCCFRF